MVACRSLYLVFAAILFGTALAAPTPPHRHRVLGSVNKPDFLPTTTHRDVVSPGRHGNTDIGTADLTMVGRDQLMPRRETTEERLLRKATNNRDKARAMGQKMALEQPGPSYDAHSRLRTKYVDKHIKYADQYATYKATGQAPKQTFEQRIKHFANKVSKKLK